MRFGLYLFLLLISVLGLAFVYSASSDFAHNSHDIRIMKKDFKNLQWGVDNHKFFTSITTSNKPAYIGGHLANEIIVFVNGEVKTMDEALSTKLGLCSNSIEHPDYDLVFGHFASEINITIINKTNGQIELSLQDAVDQGYFCTEWKLKNTCNTNCKRGIKCVRAADSLKLDDKNFCRSSEKPEVSCNFGSCPSAGSSGGSSSGSSETCYRPSFAQVCRHSGGIVNEGYRCGPFGDTDTCGVGVYYDCGHCDSRSECISGICVTTNAA